MSLPFALSTLIGFSVNHAVNGGEPEFVQNNDLELVYPSAASSTMEATSVYDQISAQNELWFAWHQLQQQLYLLSCKTGPDETGGHSIIQSPQVHDDRRTDPEPQPTAPACRPCKRSFKRNQEYKRHMRDVHTDRDQKPDCPFCTFKWTRPSKIKDHIITAHKECLAPDILLEIAALRGKRLTQYLDSLSQDTNKEAAFQSISSSHGPIRVSV